MQPNNGLIFRVLKTPPDALGIDPVARTVLLTFLDYWNPKRSGAEVWPGFKRLTWQTGISESVLRRAIRRLEAYDLVKTQRQRNAPNRYTLNVALIGRLCDEARPFEPVRSTGESSSGSVESTDRDRSDRPPNALSTPSDRLKAFPDHSQGPRQRSMPMLGDVAAGAANALRKKSR